MLVDRHMPRYDVCEARHTLVHAHVEETHDALGAARLDDVILRLAFTLSRLPSRIKARAEGHAPLRLPPRPTLKDLAWREDWVVLDERPEDELVAGVALKVRPLAPPRLHRIAASDFASFHEPRTVKVALDASMRPHGRERTLLSFEARAVATDAPTRRLLKGSWAVGAPLVRYALARSLDAVRRKAEHLPPPPRETGAPRDTAPGARGSGRRQAP